MWYTYRMTEIIVKNTIQETIECIKIKRYTRAWKNREGFHITGIGQNDVEITIDCYDILGLVLFCSLTIDDIINLDCGNDVSIRMIKK